jgi:hypothetical protein
MMNINPASTYPRGMFGSGYLKIDSGPITSTKKMPRSDALTSPMTTLRSARVISPMIEVPLTASTTCCGSASSGRSGALNVCSADTWRFMRCSISRRPSICRRPTASTSDDSRVSSETTGAHGSRQRELRNREKRVDTTRVAAASTPIRASRIRAATSANRLSM